MFDECSRKIYGRVLINGIRKGTEAAIGEEQCGLKKRRGCVDQIFVVKQFCEKFPAFHNKSFAFMDLEKAHYRLDRRSSWQEVSVYSEGRKLLRLM